MKEIILKANAFGHVAKIIKPDACAQVFITHKHCTAKISLFGGHVLSWQPKDHEEVFWLSHKAVLDGSKPIRGGIPICWPWFGPFKNEINHGFARNTVWEVDEISIDDQAVDITLRIFGRDTTSNGPYDYEVLQKLHFSEVFKQQLVIVNTGREKLQFSNALHSYFLVSHPKNVTIPCLNNSVFDDKILGKHSSSPAELSDCVGPIDRVYYNDENAEIFDSGFNRKITIKKRNSAHWVLWNPDRNIAAGMADLHKYGENEFVCLEAANTDNILVEPMKSITLSQEICISKNKPIR